jgi:hypothetical protein
MASYLNADAIKSLEQHPLDFQIYIKQMIEAETKQPSTLDIMMRSRKPQLNIDML